MKDIWLFLIHLLTVAAKLLGPGGVMGIIAENGLLKQQLLVVCRPRQRTSGKQRTHVRCASSLRRYPPRKDWHTLGEPTNEAFASVA